MNWPSYEEWADAAVSIDTLQLGRNACRDIYQLPNGELVAHDVHFPWNFFKDNWALSYLCGVQVQQGTLLPEGGQLVQMYCEDGWGVPQWVEGKLCMDTLRAAYEWARARATT